MSSEAGIPAILFPPTGLGWSAKVLGSFYLSTSQALTLLFFLKILCKEKRNVFWPR